MPTKSPISLAYTETYFALHIIIHVIDFKIWKLIMQTHPAERGDARVSE